MTLPPAVPAIALAAASLLAVPPAGAVTQLKLASRNAVDVCQGSLPSYEGALRKRPLAIANEGAAGAFIGCSMPTFEEVSAVPQVAAVFTNRGGVSATIHCTLVSGTALPQVPATYHTASVTLAAGASGPILWTSDAGAPYSIGNLNCTLPAGVEINIVQNSYVFDVGA